MANITKIIFGEKSEFSSDTLFVNSQDFEIPHGMDYKLAIEDLKRIQNKTIHGKNFLSLFEYDGISLWWFIYQSLIPKYKHLTNFVEKFLNLIDKYNPQLIRVENHLDKINIISEICSSKGIKLEYSIINFNQQLIKNKIKNKLQKNRYAKINSKKINERKKLFQKNLSSINFENKIIFALPTSYRRTIFDTTQEKSFRGEHLIQPVINSFDKNEILGLDLDYTFRGDLEILSERINDSSMDWIPLENILNTSSDPSKFLHKYLQIIKEKEFQNLFVFKNISLWNSLSSFFQSISFDPFLPNYLQVIDSLTKFFEKNKPRAIFLPYETGPLSLAIIIAAKKHNVKTIGLQHGYIYKYNPMYSFDSFHNQNNDLGFIIPEKILLFGNQTKKLLLSNNYPKKNLFVFGNPNFFNIDEMIKIFSKKNLFQKFGISENKKIILFTTGKLQPFYTNHGVYDYDVQIWKKLLENFSNNSNYYLLLKPHPEEKNIQIYEQILNNFNSKNAKIVQNNINELIFISSVVISVFSTTMLDSLCFKKPVIRVQFSEDNDSIFNNINSIVNSNLNDLTSLIQKIFIDSEMREKLLTNTKEFIFDNYGIPNENIDNMLSKILE